MSKVLDLQLRKNGVPKEELAKLNRSDKIQMLILQDEFKAGMLDEIELALRTPVEAIGTNTNWLTTSSIGMRRASTAKEACSFIYTKRMGDYLRKTIKEELNWFQRLLLRIARVTL